jgi:hypothetical protein
MQSCGHRDIGTSSARQSIKRESKNISIRDPLNTKPREILPEAVTQLRQLLEARH